MQMDDRHDSSTILPNEYMVPRWFVAYTQAHHERRVAQQFVSRGVEFFLPSYTAVRQWKDRRVPVELPLFPGYIFVNIALRDRLQVLQVPSVVRLVGNGHPVAVPDDQIDVLRNGLQGGYKAEPYPFLKVGKRVRIHAGPLAGLEGTLMRKKNCFRFVISLECIMRSIVVDIDSSDLEPMRESKV